MADPRLVAPYVPTPPAIVDALLDFAGIGPGDVVVELGAGDGRVLVAAAQRGARCTGYELDGTLAAAARSAARHAGVDERVGVETGDLHGADLAAADVVLLYLLPDSAPQLLPTLLAGVRPGGRVVSHDYELTPWEPVRSQRLDFDEKRPISGSSATAFHEYVLPADAATHAGPLLASLLGHDAGRVVLHGAATGLIEPETVRDLDWLAWRWVLLAARHHGLLARLQCALAPLADDVVPSGVRAGLLDLYRENASRSLAQRALFAGMAAMLSASDIPCAVAGGPALAVLAHGSAALRDADELEVLVPPELVDRAGALIRRTGGGARVGALLPGEEVEPVDVHGHLVDAVTGDALVARVAAAAARRRWSRLADLLDLAALV